MADAIAKTVSSLSETDDFGKTGPCGSDTGGRGLMNGFMSAACGGQNAALRKETRREEIARREASVFELERRSTAHCRVLCIRAGAVQRNVHGRIADLNDTVLKQPCFEFLAGDVG